MLENKVLYPLFYLTLFVFFCIGIWAGVGRNKVQSMDSFLTARGTQTWLGLGLNLFAAGLGVWTIFTLPQVGYDLGFLGNFAYAFACILPLGVLVLMGRVLKERAPNGVTITGFVLQRYGWLAQVITNLASLGYMLVYLISELTALGQFLAYFGVDQTWPLISVCLATAIYTAIGGMPASLLTDKFQGWFVMGLVVLATIAIATEIHLDPTVIQGSPAFASTEVGWEAIFTLGISVTAANVLHQGYWQRVYSSRSQKDLLYACIFAAALTFPFMFLVGLTGIIDLWRNDPTSTDINSFFDILAVLPDWTNGVVMVLTAALVCSSVDTLQSAISALIVNDILQQKGSLMTSRILTALLNIPALIIAYKGYSVLALFLIADLVAACVVLPVVIGLFRKWDRFFTGTDFAIGCICGILSVVCYGWGETGSFSYGWQLLALPNSIFVPVESVVVFILAPAGSAVGMVISAFVRRAILRLIGRNPDARPAAPGIFVGCGTDNLGEKPADRMAPEVVVDAEGKEENKPDFLTVKTYKPLIADSMDKMEVDPRKLALYNALDALYNSHQLLLRSLPDMPADEILVRLQDANVQDPMALVESLRPYVNTSESSAFLKPISIPIPVDPATQPFPPAPSHTHGPGGTPAPAVGGSSMAALATGSPPPVPVRSPAAVQAGLARTATMRPPNVPEVYTGPSVRPSNTRAPLFASQDLDLAILMDCTASMKPVIKAVENRLQDLLKRMKEEYDRLNIRVAFVGYRDFDAPEQYTIFDFRSIEAMLPNLRNIRTDCGPNPDTAEDVLGGYYQVNELKWSSKFKILLHFGDAPGHGSRFHNWNFPNCDHWKDTPPPAHSAELAEIYLRELIEKRVYTTFFQ
ncbi:hypothetical protein HK101_003067, partial [Irineochytrium annulatum]